MKLYTPEKAVLLDVTAIRPHPEGLIIEGRIMDAMPMKAVLRSDQLRAARHLIGWVVVRRAIAMILGTSLM
ncbi:MAG TPA: hypothetical protein VF509_09575 [Sphingobium sp.]